MEKEQTAMLFVRAIGLLFLVFSIQGMAVLLLLVLSSYHFEFVQSFPSDSVYWRTFLEFNARDILWMLVDMAAAYLLLTESKKIASWVAKKVDNFAT